MKKVLTGLSPNTENFVNITWQVNSVCNYRCSYCSEIFYANENLNPGSSLFKGLNRLLESYEKNNQDQIYFFFTGGEPTKWKPFLEVVDFLSNHSRKIKIGVNTNLSQNLEWWSQNSKYFDVVIASFHSQFANIESFYEKFHYLSDQINHLQVRMMMTNQNAKETKTLAEEIKAKCKNYRIEYAPVFEKLEQGSKLIDYEGDSKALINDVGLEVKCDDPVPLKSTFSAGTTLSYSNGEEEIFDAGEMIIKGKNKFKGWRCMLKHHLFISSSGEAYQSSCGVKSSVGNIYKDLPLLLRESVVCPFEVCHCGSDISIPKISK